MIGNTLALNEADTCRTYVLPRLVAAGWENEPHSLAEQRTFTDGRIITNGRNVRRGRPKRADYLLRYRKDFPLAVVEAKAAYKSPSDGLQQAREYAEILDLPFAYATNGHGIVEFDRLTGLESEIPTFPTPDELWARYRGARGLTSDELVEDLLQPLLTTARMPRYYQQAAINRTVEAILTGQDRLLLTLATGTGKTNIAFNICWKLWSARWNRRNDRVRPRILFLADRNVLVDDPMNRDFSPFADARYKIHRGTISTSREMYFATYQAIAGDERKVGLYRQYERDFFDLIVIDEAHRGSANYESNWREILDYFHPAVQLGMTATPLRDDNRDTYRYFGNPIYTYTLKQGIRDGFLAPYRVHRVQSSADAVGWRPDAGQLDRYGRVIPDRLYETPQFDDELVLRARSEAIARHLAAFMREDDRFAKTIVFCRDQEHADLMRRLIANENRDLMVDNNDYVSRVTADEGDIGKGHLAKFQDIETKTPVILTTSQLLSTGVDAPTCRNVVLARRVTTMVEFKQIIGRGTRVRDDYGKYYFNIIDYTGSATELFADPDFDGDPALIAEYELEDPEAKPLSEFEPADDIDDDEAFGIDSLEQDDDEDMSPSRKFYVDDGEVQIVAHLVYELDALGNQLRVVSYVDYARDEVRRLFPHSHELRARWQDPTGRREITDLLEQRGLVFEDLVNISGMEGADPFDVLCHLAFNAPVRTRLERAARVREQELEFWNRYSDEAAQVLDALLDRYSDVGATEFALPEVLKVAPIDHFGNVAEISERFGGAVAMRDAVEQLQQLIYAA